MSKLGPKAALIFRITHVKNVPWILKHGMCSRTSDVVDPNFVAIGMPELIEKQVTRPVPLDPGGLLGDYVPFYFTPWSVMMYNIKTGYNGVIQRANAEIAILVSSLYKLEKLGIQFVFTDGHAYMQESDYYKDLCDLDTIDWDLLRKRDFKLDPEDPGKLGRYQAEALVHGHVPVEALLGIACCDNRETSKIRGEAQRLDLDISVEVLKGWYF